MLPLCLRQYHRSMRGGSGAACLLAALAGACGARTALDEPCIVPLERERPAIVFLVEWSAACDNYRGGCAADSLFQGLDQFEVTRLTLGNVLPLLDDVALIGAMPTQTIRYGDPVDDPDGSSENWCATTAGLTVPIGEGHASLVERYFSLEEWPHGAGPNGQGAVLPALVEVERALLAAGNHRTPRFIVLIDAGDRGCPGVDGVLDVDEDVHEAIRAVFAALVERGIRTLVIGMRRFTADGWPFLRQQEILNAEADGGGLARSDDAFYPVWFYDYVDMPAIDEVLHAEIVAPYYCVLHLPRPVPDASAAVMIALDGQDVPRRDSDRVDGWDFLDASRVGLFGMACERAIASPRSFALRVSATGC